ncbi:hypothetical protein HZ326_30679 [Fusarium oxysporum f. sp. albedinis]|nr:hypothetical protein HZ326_30679 [Fusarium oxysporum f. sp. albedinis]
MKSTVNFRRFGLMAARERKSSRASDLAFARPHHHCKWKSRLKKQKTKRTYGPVLGVLLLGSFSFTPDPTTSPLPLLLSDA